MSDIYSFEGNKREKLGKGASRALRNEGKIPAIIYGLKEDEISLSLEKKLVQKKYEEGKFTAKLFQIDLDGKKIQVLPKDVQLYPVTDNVLHVDFLRVNEDSEVSVLVKVEFLNRETCPGIKRGGVLSVAKRKVELVCKANSIPEQITVDLGQLKIGDSVHSSNVKYPEGVAPAISDRDFTIAAIVGKGVAKAETEETEDKETDE